MLMVGRLTMNAIDHDYSQPSKSLGPCSRHYPAADREAAGGGPHAQATQRVKRPIITAAGTASRPNDHSAQ